MSDIPPYDLLSTDTVAAYIAGRADLAALVDAPLLFRDEERPELPDPVAPAVRSESALAKARSGHLPDGTPVHSVRTLLAEMGTLTRNRVVPVGAPDGAAFDLVAIPTPLQARALSLLGLTPSSV